MTVWELSNLTWSGSLRGLLDHSAPRRQRQVIRNAPVVRRHVELDAVRAQRQIVDERRRFPMHGADL